MSGSEYQRLMPPHVGGLPWQITNGSHFAGLSRNSPSVHRTRRTKNSQDIHMPKTVIPKAAAAYEDKLIAFVDILGFRNLVIQSEETDSPSLESLLDLTRRLGSSEDSARYAGSGFRITQVSDCVVVSSEVSPVGVINLLQHCFEISVNILMVGHLCRGYATRGKIFHTDGQFMGSGYMKALDCTETSGGTLFIQIDQSVCTYVAGQGGGAANKIFNRMTESDGRDIVISPFLLFKNLPSAVIDRNFDSDKWKANVQVVRAQAQKLIAQLNQEGMGAPARVLTKIARYKRKLAEVLAIKDREDELPVKLSGS
jgi:hypothetical protein